MNPTISTELTNRIISAMETYVYTNGNWTERINCCKSYVELIVLLKSELIHHPMTELGSLRPVVLSYIVDFIDWDTVAEHVVKQYIEETGTPLPFEMPQ
ncbi:hypothetical protein [Methanococcus maripaludis]|uniref:Uncharacterized protein n=3 Tax=Methanococcus maripaludis TaxID=39152 RepID=A0A7J9PEZ2_METMI|nr:hypothetical protein [Methanococcus maripaludis]MBA2861835.1 hypothetical protein [Methanococcus maripaludis]